jgi:hypothetical protein
VSDVNGNPAIEVSQTVNVTDNQIPVITTNGDQNLSAEAGLCEASFTATASATDNCSVGNPTGLRSDGLELTDPYPVGETTITWNVSDIHGNPATEVIQTITVTDNELPVISTNGDQDLNAEAGICDAIFTATASATDNCSVVNPTGLRSDGLELTDPYSVGETTITWTVSDVNGNPATEVIQTITVTDNELPVITTNGDQNLDSEAGICEASFTATASATDNCSVGNPIGLRSDGLELTDPYSVGETTITWNVSDIHGNPATEVIQTITVTDTQVPVITTNGDQNLDSEAGLCEASFTATASATDNCSVGNPTGLRSDGLELTDPYSVGETTITWTVSDVNGNPATEVIQTITVNDTELPTVLTRNRVFTIENGETLTISSADINNGSSDNCGILDFELDITTFSSLNEGENTVILTVRDVNGNSNSASAIVTISLTEVDSDGDGFTPSQGDCDDSDDTVYPGAPEICDGKDNDCDGLIDGEDSDAVGLTTYYRDQDGDGYGDSSISVQSCNMPTGYVADNTDCNDADDTIYPGAPEICDGKDNDCDGLIDGEDPDVVGLTTYYRDQDGDGFGNASIMVKSCNLPTGYVTNSQDCNDADDTIYPGAPEVCDGKDNDCDGLVDGDDPKAVGLTTYYLDQDGDGYGDSSSMIESCNMPVGYVTNSQDCDDSDVTVYPGAPELCDGKDNNCDGTIDEGVKTAFYIDVDGDGFGNASIMVKSCNLPTGYVTNSQDCNDADDTIYPGAPEVCDGKDNDCDGLVDGDDPKAVGLTTYYLDQDGDGYGNSSSMIESCNMPVGYVTNSQDCDDSDDTVYPGAPEICDGKDNDCDGLVDGDDPDAVGLTTYYLDEDRDGYGDSSSMIESCNIPRGYVTDNTDCDDSDEFKNPGIVGSCVHDPCSEDLVITSITGPLDPNPINTVINVSAIVVGNPVDAYWNWDDGTTTSMVDFNSGFVATHIYSTAGVYQISLIVIDACGREVERLTDLAVVYDPNGGFVTGGGTIWSPKGAYLANLEAEGRANFGFIAKYRKGSNRVDGNTEFQFKNGGLNFHSSSYEDMSLVISGYKALYKGQGSINGILGYSFMVSAIDGNKKDVIEPDKFRIKIWKSATSEIIYDNQYGASDRDDATTNLTGGSIVIHNPNKGNNKSINESDLIVVDWNTSKELLQGKLNGFVMELTGNSVVWNMDLFEPVLEGVQFIDGLMIDSEATGILENVQAAVLVLDKVAPTDITLSDQIVPMGIKVGDVIGLLETVDPADNNHEYEIKTNPNFYIEENRLIWKGGELDNISLNIKVSSIDIVGNVIEKDFTLSLENVPSTVLVYPNPASTETNVKVDFSQPSIVSLKLFDAAGRLVFEESGDYEKGFIRKIDLRELSNGLYQIQVQINFETITKRLVKVN